MSVSVCVGSEYDTCTRCGVFGDTVYCCSGGLFTRAQTRIETVQRSGIIVLGTV